MSRVMNRHFQLILPGIVLLAFSCSAVAELVPTPKFSNHEIPTASVPDIEDSIWPILDIGILLAALSAASYFTLVSRSRRNLLVLTIGSLLWFGFWRQGCVCSIGATQNVALAIFDPTYVIPLTVVAFFVLPLIFTLFFGRTFCAAVCPLGAMQELVAVRTVAVPRWLDHSLGLVAYIYLGASVIFAASGTAFIICRYDPFIPFFRMAGNTDMLIFGSCVLLIGLFVGRPYCRYLCPYGAILRILSCFSKWRLSIPPDSCVNCQLCEDVCPYGAIHPPTAVQSASSRKNGKRQLAASLICAPLLLITFTWLGYSLAIPLSEWHPVSRLAEQMRLEETGTATEPSTDASDAFRATGQPVDELYHSAIELQEQFRWLGIWLGGWTGLVIAIKLIHLSLRRRRDDYQADRAGCVSCGRCYWYCPVEKVRLGLIEDVSECFPIIDAPSKKEERAIQETKA